jgi:hypothetical protein
MLVYLFFIVLSTASVHSDEHFVVDILEHGITVKQEVTSKEGLQIIHVPAHRHLVEVELYIDFDNELQLVKLISENKCQLSKLDQGAKPISLNQNHRQSTPLDSSAMQHTNLVRLEANEPLTNLTYLRKEMQAACSNLPTFWVDSIEENLYYSQRLNHNPISLGNSKYQFPPYTRNADSMKCPHEGGIIGGQIVCHPECFFQLCDPNGGNWCYYNAIHCPLVTPSCWQHISNMQLSCRPCCSSSKAPCNTKIPYCGCYANGPTGK